MCQIKCDAGAMQIFMLHPNTRCSYSRWQELAPGGFNTMGDAQRRLWRRSRQVGARVHRQCCGPGEQPSLWGRGQPAHQPGCRRPSLTCADTTKLPGLWLQDCEQQWASITCDLKAVSCSSCASRRTRSFLFPQQPPEQRAVVGETGAENRRGLLTPGEQIGGI